MANALKKSWHDLAQEPPGQRFQNRHRRNHESGPARGRTLKLAAGIILIVAGIILLPIPGPGSIVVVLGAAFLAQESLIAARLLDRSELLLRRLAAYGADRWQRTGPIARMLIFITGALLLISAAWLAYFLLQR